MYRCSWIHVRRLMLDLMLPYTLIDPDAAFSKAFITVGMHWAAYIVAIGALLGIVTGAGWSAPWPANTGLPSAQLFAERLCLMPMF